MLLRRYYQCQINVCDFFLLLKLEFHQNSIVKHIDISSNSELKNPASPTIKAKLKK